MNPFDPWDEPEESDIRGFCSFHRKPYRGKDCPFCLRDDAAFDRAKDHREERRRKEQERGRG